MNKYFYKVLDNIPISCDTVQLLLSEAMIEAIYTCVPLYLMLSVGRDIRQGSDRTQL